MHSDIIPKEFFNLLPLPILINKPLVDDLNSTVVFLNTQFLTEIGWTLEDIPDKNHWWQAAYPDATYQKVIERQWELGVSNALEKMESFVYLNANIMSKFSGQRRYKIYTQINSQMLPGYNIVAFGNSDGLSW